MLKKHSDKAANMLNKVKAAFTEKNAKVAISVLTAATVLAAGGFFWSAQSYQAEAMYAAYDEAQLQEQLEMATELQTLRLQLAQAQAENETLRTEKETNEDLAAAQQALSEGLSLEYIGEYKTTAYCCEVYPHICGGNGVTASGTVPTPGITCAADWNVLPPGTWLYIEDVGVRRVEDSGSAIKGNRLDIAIDTHENALRWSGMGTHRVWVLLPAEE